MDFIQVKITPAQGIDNDILIAILDQEGFQGFEETADNLLAYIAEEQFDKTSLETIITTELAGHYEIMVIPAQNWNAVWESNFQPVVIPGFCTLRAHFHDMEVTTPHEIIITPKMSFGTGHHATTRLVMSAMRNIDFTGKEVLDFGTGTGILAILAEQLHATGILAIDNDPWSVENAGENVERNNCHHISVVIGSMDAASGKEFDVILANINRHILLAYMGKLSASLRVAGSIIMSGILIEDREIIIRSAEDNGLIFNSIGEENGWIAIVFKKNMGIFPEKTNSC